MHHHQERPVNSVQEPATAQNGETRKLCASGKKWKGIRYQKRHDGKQDRVGHYTRMDEEQKKGTIKVKR